VLHDPARHEPLGAPEWDAEVARQAIDRIVHDAEQRYTRESAWPLHPLDADGGAKEPAFDLYGGALGVAWALHYLDALGAAQLHRSYRDELATLRSRNRARLGPDQLGSFLAGDTGALLVDLALARSEGRSDDHTADELAALIAGNLDHPVRELMHGSPGTMLAALFLHEHRRDPRWATHFVATARKLWSQLEWSPDFRCRYWTQQLGRHRCTYLGAVHGFAATAAVIIRGRHLLGADEWSEWQRCIVETMRATVEREGDRLNWRPFLYPENGVAYPPKRLMQVCHGAPGIVIDLAGLPTDALDAELVAAGEAIWEAGPLRKGSGLCHGTGGNGYAFLRLFDRTGDERWLARGRAFAMHAIAQMEAQAYQYGQLRYSLWTGDPGLAIYLWDCLRGAGSFPTVDCFFAGE
jgi:Lanthionine synthetase C-like protein